MARLRGGKNIKKYLIRTNSPKREKCTPLRCTRRPANPRAKRQKKTQNKKKIYAVGLRVGAGRRKENSRVLRKRDKPVIATSVTRLRTKKGKKVLRGNRLKKPRRKERGHAVGRSTS